MRAIIGRSYLSGLANRLRAQPRENEERAQLASAGSARLIDTKVYH